MPLYAIRDGKLERIREDDFKLEKDLQKICDDNLETLFRLKLVKSQFAIENFRIDTLAFDEETKAFVVIEYKKGENFSVIDQGYTYLSLVLNNKAECVLAYQEAFGKSLRKTEVEWSQTRVIFVSPYFTTYQINSINFKDLRIWKIAYRIAYSKPLPSYNTRPRGGCFLFYSRNYQSSQCFIAYMQL